MKILHINIKKTALIVAIVLYSSTIFKQRAIAQSLPPGIVVAKTPDSTKSFFASPSIVVLPDGSYLISHDKYGSLYKNEPKKSTIYKSTDKGKTWNKLAEVSSMYWANLFVHKGAVYLMGTTGSIGDIVISKSVDGGKTWTKPVDENTGLLFKGRYHTAPMPTVESKGRLWRAYEVDPDPNAPRKFEAFMLSIPANADLLKAINWTKSNSLLFDANSLNARAARWREGNAVVTPDGSVVDIIRLETRQKPKDTYKMLGVGEGFKRYEVAAAIKVSDDGKQFTFDPKDGLISFPGAETKFTIRYDPVSKKYWSLVNKITANKPGSNFETSPHHQRNVVMLISSPDLKKWTEHTKLLRWEEGKTITMKDGFAFQYLDWQFDDNDIIAVSRTAWNSINYHDSNYITFHRFEGFRSLTMADSGSDLADLNLNETK